MEVAKIQVSGTCARTVYAVPITAGMIGAKVKILYTDPVWDGLSKTVVFKGAGTKDVVTQDQFVTIPAEVIAQDYVRLQVGIYGTDAEGVLAIPTLWADLGTVKPGADPSGDTTTDPSLPVWAQLQGMIGNLDDLDTNAKNNLVAAVNEAMTKGGGDVDEAEIRRIVEEYLTANPPTVTETDPTVPAWAKQPNKPTYTAEEVHAMPDTYTPPDQTAQQVGADPAGTAAATVSQHNVDTAAHNDLRIALQELANRVNAALDSDDITLDQMSEVVAYIKSNKTLIDAITTNKVSVSDIANDLVTNVADKPLSAAQGVALKGLIEELRALIPEAYTLPGATEKVLGGVKPVTATDEMTQPVGVTADFRLVTKPGEGGSGISVTGATVGQTVKISAVDDGGVPTAWEPVDFPVVEWELIGEVALGEGQTANVITIDKDLNGNPFELGEFLLLLLIPGDDCTTERLGRIYINGKTPGGTYQTWIDLVSMKGIASSNNCFISTHGEIVADYAECSFKQSTASNSYYENLDNIYNSQAFFTANVSNYWASTRYGLIGKATSFSSVSITMFYNDTPMQDGTKVRLLGVRK